MTQSISKPFEIVSLIFMRGFFKDIAELRGTNELVSLSREVWPALWNVSAGLLMFLHAARRRGDDDRPVEELREVEKFIYRKS